MNMHAARVAPKKAVFRPALPLCSQPGITEMQMAKSYADQIKHPKWQKRRLEMLDEASFTCSACGATEKTLHVHHKRYVKGRQIWEYSDTELEVLCEDCHGVAHDLKDRLARVLLGKFMGEPAEQFTYGLLCGFLQPFGEVKEEDWVFALQHHTPSFEVGYFLAALGYSELKEAVRAKVEAGRIPSDHPILKHLLEE